MDAPLLLNPDAFEPLKAAWELGRTDTLRRAEANGCCDAWLRAAETVSSWLAGSMEERRNAGAWKAAAAAELMVVAMTDPSAAHSIHAQLETATGQLEIAPGYPLAALLSRRAAGVLVPFYSGAGTGFLDHLWLVEGGEGGDCDFTDWSPIPGCEVVQVKRRPDGAKMNGLSWQHPLALASKALLDSDPERRRTLAADWITTGKVDEGQVGRVGLGGKLELEKLGRHRRWLLPWGTEPGADFQRATAGGRLCFTQNLQGSWAHITGVGIAGGGVEEWPPPHAATLHIFVSRALGPMLLSIVYALPSRLVLWASEDMEEQCRTLKQALAELRVRGLTVPEPEVHPEMPSSDIAAAQRYLVKCGQVNADNGLQLFNVTGGNLLMRFAIADLAGVNPKLHLIYRDINAGDRPKTSEEKRDFAARRLEFTLLKYENRQGHTATLKPWPLPEAIAAGYLAELGRGAVFADDLTGCFPEGRHFPSLPEIRRRHRLGNRE